MLTRRKLLRRPQDGTVGWTAMADFVIQYWACTADNAVYPIISATDKAIGSGCREEITTSPGRRTEPIDCRFDLRSRRGLMTIGFSVVASRHCRSGGNSNQRRR